MPKKLGAAGRPDILVTLTILSKHVCREGTYAESPLLTIEERLWMTQNLGKRLRITYEVLPDGEARSAVGNP